MIDSVTRLEISGYRSAGAPPLGLWLVVSVAALTSVVAPAGGALDNVEPAREQEAELWPMVTSGVLKSAYLGRALSDLGAMPQAPASVDEQQVQLQRHFDRVVKLLEDNTDESLQTALDRLEQARDVRWTRAERARWREKLAAERARQLARLRAYRDRGLFPRNEGHAPQAVPIFVDRHGTACAVGHLMRLSGREVDVAHVAATNNLVCVPDVTSGPLVRWVLNSGLTQEEAAMIQPAYDIPFLCSLDPTLILCQDPRDVWPITPYPPGEWPEPIDVRPPFDSPPLEPPIRPLPPIRWAPPQPSLAEASVPEPSSLTFGVMALAAFALTGRQRRSGHSKKK